MSGSGFQIVLAVASTREAAENAADVTVNVAESGRHEAAKVCDGEQSKRDADDGVDNSHHLAPRSLRRYMSVAYTSQPATRAQSIKSLFACTYRTGASKLRLAARIRHIDEFWPTCYSRYTIRLRNLVM